MNFRFGTLHLREGWDEALSALAWQLATTSQSSLRNPREAVQLAEQACAISRRENLTHLDALIVAYAVAGRHNEALQVCRECINKATAAGMTQRAEEFRQMEKILESQRPSIPRRTG